MTFLSSVVSRWKISLTYLLEYYTNKRKVMKMFFLKLFVFFVFINFACYWLAMFTAFPELCKGYTGYHYLKVSIPVGFLGALFDSLSFFVTIYIVKRALTKTRPWDYMGHLSIDLLIAILATFWVVFVFNVSGWFIHLFDDFQEQAFVERQTRYEAMVLDALEKPADNWRNIYFGLLMGLSAGLPTFIHLVLFAKSILSTLKSRPKHLQNN